MRKFLGGALVFVFAFTGLVVQGGSSPANAAAAPTIFTVVCTNQSTFDQFLPGINWPSGTSRVVTALIGDTFVIENTGSANCAFSSGTGLATDSAAIANGAPRTVTVANSGTFTITPAGGVATTFFVDACSLPGSGISTDPWLVATLADFAKVGEESTDVGTTSCSLSGSYLQTANILNVDTASGDPIAVASDTFTGTYDGDHYNISYFSGGANGDFLSRDPLFDEVGPGGVIKRLSLSGNIRSNTTRSSSLVDKLYGGTISEVRSTVLIQVDDDNDAVIGGLAARSGEDSSNALIIYSKFDGRIEWLESSPGSEQEGPVIGGLVGEARGTGTTEIRDSYSRAAISFNSGGLTNNAIPGVTHPDAAVFAGGLVGSDGRTQILAGADFATNTRVHTASSLSIIRSYFAGSFTNTCVGTAAQCNTDSPSHVFTGGLIGVSEGRDDTDDLLVSAFWLSSSATNAIGGIVVNPAAEVLVYTGAQPLDYTASSPFLPEAPGLSASVLRTLSTYQSRENSTTSGQPSGLADLVVGSSTDGSLTEQDYRWAIEGGNIQTFVASSYGDEADFLQRSVYADPSGEKIYRRQGAGDLTVHGGSDPRTVTGYPALGRVWEICANSNDGFPFLVWEELDCSAGGDGGGTSGASITTFPGGLSAAEYAEFLKSGLTLEQFMAQRLAATGPSDAALGLGGLSAVLLGFVGAALVLVARRQVSRKPR